MIFKAKKLLIFWFLFAALASSGAYLLAAEMTPEELASEQSELQKQLQDIEAQIAEYQKELSSVQGEKNTLQNKINKLKKQQATLNLQIKETGLRLKDLGGQIAETQSGIETSTEKIEKLRKQIGNVLELLYVREDSNRLLYLILSKNNLSDMVAALNDYATLTQGLSALLEQTKDINEQLKEEKDVLSIQEEDAKNLLSIQNLQREKLSGSVSEQNTLLQVTKGKESNYQEALSDQKKRAQTIRGRLYQLLDVEKQINFEQAVKIADWASGQTGVRTAFLLSVLTQESNLGKNVGTCNRAGDPPTKSWKVVMHPTRDQPHFATITSELGRDPDITPISCPMRDSRGRQIGYGGAMGPAQFIPSTWMGYRGKVTAVTGNPADPWDIRDAFLASAIKLGADGATTKDGEWAAAMRYFSGSTNTKYRFYGDSVVERADEYQKDIDDINS